MPYVQQSDRDRLDPKIQELVDIINPDHRAGELNYIINRLLLATEGEGKYKDFNELLGALEAAKIEFYRRRVAPYEDIKVQENGDLKGFDKSNQKS